MWLSNYLDRVRAKGNPQLAQAINNTVQEIVPQYISNFSYREHVVSLLVGDVQSGKTSHMFGLMSAAADEGFGIFILGYWCGNYVRSRKFCYCNYYFLI